MNRQHEVSAGVLFYVVKECAELAFASSRLDIPRRFSFPDHDETLGSGEHIRAKPIYLRWIAIGAS